LQTEAFDIDWFIANTYNVQHFIAISSPFVYNQSLYYISHFNMISKMIFF